MSQQTTRPTKKLGELTPGDFVFHRRQSDAEPGIVCEVKAMLPYRDGDGRATVSGLLVPVHGGAPLHVRQFANVLYVMATDGDVREASEVARRIEVANALRQVADDIVAQALPVPRYSFTVGGVLDSRGELEMWAEHLGVEIRMSGDIPVADKAAGWLTVHFQSAPEPAPQPQPEPEPVEAEQEWLFTFGSGQQHDGRFVRITGTYETARARMLAVFGQAWCAQYDWRRFDEEGLPAKLTELPESDWSASVETPGPSGLVPPAPIATHYETGGWGTGPGQCGVECACGTTFDGFGTIAEAAEHLKRHIADATAQAGE